MKRIFSIIILSMCIFTTVAFVSANGIIEKEKTNLNQSATVKDVTLTINNYAISNNKLIVNYTVQSKENHTDKTTSLIERPDILIGDKLIHGNTQSYKKVSENNYTGTIEADLPQNLPSKFNVKFNTDAILDQEGQWNIDFIVE